MRELTIQDIIGLVTAETPDAEMIIQQMFEWHYDRVKSTSQWIIGAAATLFIAVLVALFSGELKIELWQSVLVVITAIGTAVYGIYRFWQLRLMHRQFITALKLYTELSRMRHFFIRYRRGFTR